MKITIGTTTGFHLCRLARELRRAEVNVRYYCATPDFRNRRDGLDSNVAVSLFWPLAPLSIVALMRGLPADLQSRAVQARFRVVDEAIADRLEPCDAFIGLSAMSIRSARRARELGAKVIIERGSRHVLSQNELLTADGGKGLSAEYIDRELRSYAEADIITVLSSHAAESFIRQGVDRARLFVCPLGVDVARFIPSPRPNGQTRLLFVGAWSYRKGVDLLTQAVLQRPAWSLTHIGSIADCAFPHNSRIVSLGHKTHPELAEAMKDHHILVLPSREDGFGMVLLEALAAGLPIVASNMTGAPDIKRLISNNQAVGVSQAGDTASLLRTLDEMVELEATWSPCRVLLTEDDRAAISWQSYGTRYRLFLSELTVAPARDAQ